VKISSIFTANSIKAPLEGTDKEEVIEELVDLLVRNGRIADREAALDAINAREAKGSTGIGEGVALPHGKTASVDQLTGAMGISPAGVEFDSADGAPVHLVLLVIADARHPGPHVECLAEIARLLRTPGFCRGMVGCSTVQEVFDRLCAEE